MKIEFAKKTKTQVLAERIYEYLAGQSRQGKVQIGYNEIGRNMGEANLGMIHGALNQLINDGKIIVLKDNGGRGGNRSPRTYGITSLLRFFESISVA